MNDCFICQFVSVYIDILTFYTCIFFLKSRILVFCNTRKNCVSHSWEMCLWCYDRCILWSWWQCYSICFFLLSWWDFYMGNNYCLHAIQMEITYFFEEENQVGTKCTKLEIWVVVPLKVFLEIFYCNTTGYSPIYGN